jgi:hypothetical protein
VAASAIGVLHLLLVGAEGASRRITVSVQSPWECDAAALSFFVHLLFLGSAGNMGFIKGADVKTWTDVITNIPINTLGSLAKVSGMESDAFVGVQKGGIKAKAKVVAEVLKHCKKLGVIESGAVAPNLDRIIGAERGAFSATARADVLNALQKVVGMDVSGLEKIVGVDLSSLKHVVGVDNRNAEWQGVRVMETLSAVFPYLHEAFTSRGVTLSISSGFAVAFVIMLFQNMDGEHKVQLFTSMVSVCGYLALCCILLFAGAIVLVTQKQASQVSALHLRGSA